MMSADQTDKACKSNVVRNLGRTQSMSMVNTQPKLITNGRAIKCQRLEESI